jgi:signal transduction histidine kinase
MTLSASTSADQFAPAQPTKSFTINLIDNLAVKVLSVATLGTGIEMFLNFLGQSKEQNPFWSWMFVVLVMAIEIAMVVFAFFTNLGKLICAIFAIVVLVEVCAWGLPLQGVMPADTVPTPWIYEALGVAGIAAGVGLPVGVAVAYLITTPVAWIVLRESTTASQFHNWDSLLGAIYVLLFSSCVSALVWMLRSSARDADTASQRAADASAASARVDAIERERLRIDALVHDQVLTTLLLTSAVKSQIEAQNVSDLAEVAIEKLITFSSLQVSDDSPITVSSLFLALKKTALAIVPDIQIDLGPTSDLEVPGEVADAISEATIQALTNSVQHAGRGVSRQIILRNHTEGVKVVIIDNGKGFREARVPKHRLGIALSIRRRMASVGGETHVKSLPNQGTSVILQWGKL